MEKELKEIILKNSEHKIFGCMHCGESSELCISDLSVMVVEIEKHKNPQTFEDAVKPLMKWMAENQHPHTTAIVTSNRVELLEGVKCHENDEFIVD